MKKIILLTICAILISSNVFAYNPHSFRDEESITVQGKRAKIDIEVSELTVNIDADDFDETGIALKTVTISNIGSSKCSVTLEVQNVPIDLIVEATVDNDVLFKNESTELTITVELTEQQDAEDFTFTVLVKAER